MQPKKQPTMKSSANVQIIKANRSMERTFIERDDQPHHGRSRVVERVDKGWLVD